MRILRLPDEHLADLIADGSTVIMTLRWHTRTPAPGDLVHLDTLGHWRVLEILRRERPGFGADLRASLLSHSTPDRSTHMSVSRAELCAPGR